LVSYDRTLEEQVDRLRRHQAAVVTLARRPMAHGSDATVALGEVCRVAATTLHVERASIWLLNEERTEMRCLSLYELTDDRHSSGTVLSAADYPAYFAALETGRAIDAHDARTDARTAEFAAAYLEPLGITSMMDAAIREDGRVIGVICHEHIGPQRVWTHDEIDFAGALADRAALVLGAVARHRLEEERERVRQQLLYTQKLESLGVLAGGMAREFERLLVLVSGNATLARELIGASHAAGGPLDEVIVAAERAQKLARQLLAYSGRGRVVVEPIDLSAQVSELRELIESSCPRQVRIRFSLDAELSWTKADAAQVQQVIMSLVVNGIEAVGGAEGEVRVRTSMRFLTTADAQGFLLGRGIPPGRYVMLEIEDSGGGLSPEQLQRIFDPFISTKGPGRGLGLAAVLGIVRNHRGAIDVQPVKAAGSGARGTRFRLYFPATDARVPRQPRQAPREPGTVVVIDDDDDVARLVRAGVSPLGLEVALVRGAEAAEAAIDAGGGRVRALLLGVGCLGAEAGGVARSLRQTHPDVPLLLLGGYDDRALTRELVAAGVAESIAKPFSAEAVSRKVADLIGVRGPDSSLSPPAAPRD
jgi:signal transduction histidine kinase/CheY-like chemotaxis protein